MRYIFLISLMMAVIVFSIAHPVLSEPIGADGIVAVVNDMVITQSEVEEYVNFTSLELSSRVSADKVKERIPEITKVALVRLIDDRLILQQALKEGLTVEDAVIEARLNEIKSRFISESDFNAAMLKEHVSISDIKKNLKNEELTRLIVDKKVRSKIYVSPQEITKFYDQYPQDFSQPEGRQVSLVYFDDRRAAERALSSLGKNNNFQQLFSNLKSYQETQEIRRGELAQDAENKIFKLLPGQISEVVEFEDRFFIFQIIKNVPAFKLTLSQAQPRAYSIVFNQKFTRELTNWLDKLKDEAYIVIR